MRIHIGNVSPKLAEDPANLERRLAKFGTITEPLALRCKPLGDVYYGFITMDLDPKQWAQMRSTFNGVTFMGTKLVMDEAKPAYNAQPTPRLKPAEARQATSEAINQSRMARIRESQASVPTNSATHHIATTPINPLAAAYGYHMSSHTYHDISANTKNRPPQATLRGRESYGSWTEGQGPHNQQYSRTSGGSEVVPGRMRKTPRSKEAMRDQTLRILMNGDLKTFKCYKTKLWGYERRDAAQLAHTFDGNAWRSGDGHVIERLGAPRTADTPVQEGPEKTVLASFMAGFDFDKPVAVDEDNGIDAEDIVYDAKGRRKVKHFDYEQHGDVAADTVVDGDAERGMALIEEMRGTAPAAEQYYSEEDDDLDFDSLKPMKPEEEEVENTDITVAPTASTASTVAPKGSTVAPTETSKPNTTESLRSLLNAGPAQGFSLALDDDDIDDAQNQVDVDEQLRLLEDIKAKQNVALTTGAPVAATKAKGLFWGHFDSAFLQAQTQLNQIGGVGAVIALPGSDKDMDYETWFYAQRGEVTAECKRRRRDVQKAFKKRKVTI
ncbi:hypothetical protein DICA2_B01772 [Diutina catenulata]